MRNVFDQYDQPENRLTHALMTTLSRERSLVLPFLKWLKARNIPALASILLAEQGVPGSPLVDTKEGESKGLPDGGFYPDDGWLLMLECKVQDKVNVGQLKRHLATAKRHGFESPQLVVIAKPEDLVDPTATPKPTPSTPKNHTCKPDQQYLNPKQPILCCNPIAKIPGFKNTNSCP